MPGLKLINGTKSTAGEEDIFDVNWKYHLKWVLVGFEIG